MTFDILVVPRASRDRFGPRQGDRIKVSVTAPPVDGEANARVIEVVAKALGVHRRDVRITAGESSRRKTISVEGVTAEALEAVLG